MSKLATVMQEEAQRMKMDVTYWEGGKQKTAKYKQNQQLNKYPPQAGKDNPSSSNTRGKRGTEVEQGERKARERSGLIDYLTVVLPDIDFLPTGDYDHDDVINSVNRFFLSNLNLKALPTLRGGKNFYSHSWDIVNKSHEVIGFVAHGGNKDTLCINITGSGTSCVGSAGYYFVWDWLERVGGRITRVDIAHDFFNGEKTVDHAINWYKSGLFKTESKKGADPNATYIDDFGSNKGRSFYVGSRQSGKMLRVYEKGKQLGDPTSPWVRFELELRNTDREIPHDILIDEARYLAGAYICLKGFAANQSYIQTHTKTAAITLQHLSKHCSIAYGRLLYILQDFYDTPDQIIQALLRDDGPPRRLKIESPVIN